MPEIGIDVFARDRGASGTLNRIGGAADRSGQSWRRMGAAAKWGGLAVAGGAALGVKALWDMGQAAAEDEGGQRRLAVAMRNTTDATRAEIGAAEEWISKKGVQLGIVDDELRPALQNLVQATGDVSEAQRLAGVAMDYSVGKGKDLTTVSEAFVKAANGNIGALGRLGIRTKNAAGETLSLRDIVKELNRVYGGQAKAAADTLEGRQKRLNLRWSEAREELGSKFIPIASRFTEWALDEAAPAVEDLAGQVGDTLVPMLEDLGDWIADEGVPLGQDLGRTFRDDVLPPLRTAGEVVGDAVEFFNDLPAPVKEFGIHAGVAAAVVPRLTSAVSGATGAVVLNISRLRQWRAEMAIAETRSAATAAATSRLGRAAGTAAGIGGLALLTSGAGEGSEAVDVLGASLTGAFTGAALGSAIPGVGTAIGGVAGAAVGAGVALWDMTKAEDQVTSSSERATAAAIDLKDTLDQVTGAATRKTREGIRAAAHDAGILAITNKLRVSNRDLIGTVLGSEAATRRLTDAYAENGAALDGPEREQFTDWLRDNGIAMARQSEETRVAYKDATLWNKALRDLPPEVKTAVKAIGTRITQAEVRQLKRQYDLTPEQVETIVNAVGTETAIRKVRGVWTVIKDGEKVRTNLQPWHTRLIVTMKEAEDSTRRGRRRIDQELSNTGDNADVNWSPFISDLNSGLNQAKGIASSGGRQIASSLTGSISSGVWGAAEALSTAAAGVVRQAIAAAKRETGGGGGGGGGGKGGGGKASPRRPGGSAPRTSATVPLGEPTFGRRATGAGVQLGEDLGEGVATGFRDSTGNKGKRGGLSKAAIDMLDDLVHTIRRKAVDGDRVLDAVRKNYKNKIQALRDTIRTRDEFAAGFQRLGVSVFGTDYSDRLEVTSSSIDPITGERTETTSKRALTAADMVAASAREKAEAAQTKADIDKLRSLGLSNAVLKQLQAEGDEETIHALAQGSRAQIAAINANQKATSSYLGQAGMTAANQLYADDIRADKRDAKIAKAIRDEIASAFKEDVRFRIDGDDLVAVIKKKEKKEGKKK